MSDVLKSRVLHSPFIAGLCVVFMLISPLAMAGGSKVNINTASEAQLASVDGISPELAKRIVEYRESQKKRGAVIVSVHEIEHLFQQAQLDKIKKGVWTGKLTQKEIMGTDGTYISGGFVRTFYSAQRNTMVSYYFDHNELRTIKSIQSLPNN